MVCEFDGTVENLQCEADYKPPHESCGFSFAKWFESEEKRDKTKQYIISQIQKRQRNK